MNIVNPTVIAFEDDQDEGMQALVTEAQINAYVRYLQIIAAGIDMEVSITLIKGDDTTITQADNELLDTLAPMFHIKVKDEELVGEFVFSEYSAPLYQRFREWINSEILFYMKSKALYRELSAKHPEKINWGKTAKI
jgi:hypothetical protein